MKALVAIALVAVAGCSAAPPAEPPAAEPAPRGPVAAKSDAISRADQIAAEAAKREAEYQQSVEEAKKPKTHVPVVTEFSPQDASVPVFSGTGSAARPEEAWWRAQMEPLRKSWHEYADAAADANRRWNAADKSMYGAERDAAVKKAIADQQRNSASAKAVLQSIHQLREKAKQMNVPDEWVKWP